MESLKHNGKLNTLVLAFLTFTSAQLFQACKSDDTSREENKIAQLAPENNSVGSFTDNGAGAIAPNNYKVEKTITNIADTTISDKDTIIVESEPYTTSESSINKESARRYDEYQNALNIKPTSLSDIPDNSEIIGGWISKYGNDYTTLMLIASSEYCNTALLQMIGTRLADQDLLSEQDKETIMRYFHIQIKRENEENPFNSKLDELVTARKKRELKKAIRPKAIKKEIAITQN